VPKINMEIPHALKVEEAKSRLERMAESLESRYGGQVKDMSQSWVGNLLTFGFKTMGMRFDGNVGVEDNKVVVNGDLPFTAMMFKGKIESEIRQQLERILRA
jgi:putative polyhydroxyalkanoate system protein